MKINKGRFWTCCVGTVGGSNPNFVEEVAFVMVAVFVIGKVRKECERRYVVSEGALKDKKTAQKAKIGQ